MSAESEGYSVSSEEEPEVPQKSRDLIIFRKKDSYFGIFIENVVEIIPMVAISPLLKPHPLIEGIIDLRGELIPVVRLDSQLYAEEGPHSIDEQIIVLKFNGFRFGLPVDSVLEVVSVAEEEMVPASRLAPGAEGLLGAVRYEGRVISILDIAAIRALEDAEGIKKALTEGETGDR